MQIVYYIVADKVTQKVVLVTYMHCKALTKVSNTSIVIHGKTYIVISVNVKFTKVISTNTVVKNIVLKVKCNIKVTEVIIINTVITCKKFVKESV